MGKIYGQNRRTFIIFTTFVRINGINRFRKKPRKAKVIAKVLAVTFFLLPLQNYTYIHGSYFFG